MSFYTQQPKQYCGIDLHARAMAVCLLAQAGTILVQKHLPTTPAAFLRVIAPSREEVVGAGECRFPWSWLADRCAQEGSAFVLGHALSRQASHGGKAKNAKLDAHKSAVLLRGGMLPQASVYPAERRAPRDLLRRRGPLLRPRAALLAPRHHTTSQSNLPEIGKQLADKANREGGEDHFPDPSLRKTRAGEVFLIAHSDQLLGEVELSRPRTAKAHAGQTLARLQSVPGIGQILALGLRSEIPDRARLPRGQAFVSDWRVVNCAQESGGNRLGTSGTKSGTVQWRWAVAAAAVLFLRHPQPGKESCTKLAPQPGKAPALPVLAQQLARAGYDRLARPQAVELTRFVTASPLRGEPEPAAARAHAGASPCAAPAFMER